jgi:plasmid stabilization system protein ParE
MSFELIYTSRARQDLLAAADSIAQHAPATAEKWFNGFVQALATLRQNADIYGHAPESPIGEIEVRQFLHRTKSHKVNRALFAIRGPTVYILAIRRPGQALLTDDEMRSAIEQLD